MCVNVVLASNGYPGTFEKGFEITIDESIEDKVFLAGAQLEGEILRTSGGRVLSVVGRGRTVEEAREEAYKLTNMVNTLPPLVLKISPSSCAPAKNTLSLILSSIVISNPFSKVPGYPLEAKTTLTHTPSYHLTSTSFNLLSVVGRGRTVEEAREEAYQLTEMVNFEGKYFRRDI